MDPPHRVRRTRARRRPALVGTLLAALLVVGCGEGTRPLPSSAPGAPARATWPALLERHAPILEYDRRDAVRATDVEAFVRSAVLRSSDGDVLGRGLPSSALGPLRPDGTPSEPGDRLDAPGRPVRGTADVVHGRAVRGTRGRLWLQYWLFLPDNPQDRGILRTGRHEGDWELVQVGLGASGRPEALTLTQHAWEEACGWTAVRRVAGRPVVAPANGSHALYRTPGEHGRPWPDPDDEARADGRRARPVVVPLGHLDPPWLAWPGRWGGSEAGLVPGESDSPPGPAFQPGRRWADPEGLHRHARACGSGAAPRPPLLQAGLGGLTALAVALLVAAVRRRRASTRR